ncbi:MAG: DNA repair protein RecN [Lachnospiraceae bacterium]|nr:DNA repair protein RecN [Lachnospiraceae bacterium]
MLRELYVKNLALIEEASVTFDRGLNILTGETGAGKSLLIGAVGLALGERTPKELLREGKEAVVSLTFEVGAREEERLRSLDLECEDGQLFLTRRISDARSVARVNGETVPLARLKEAASLLMSVHGQSEYQILKKKSTHLAFLDRFGIEETKAASERFRALYKEHNEKRKAYEETDLSEEERTRELDLLTYEIDEIEAAALTEGEDLEAEREFTRLSNHAKIREAIEAVETCLTEGEASASWQVSRALGEWGKILELDPAFQGVYDTLSDLDSVISDLHRELDSLKDVDEDEEERLYLLTERLDLINRLKQKYAPDIPGILRLLEEKKERQASLTELAERREAARTALEESERALLAAAGELTEKRRSVSASFDRQMTEALADLNFLDVRFSTKIEALPAPGPLGSDDVEFLISLNPGEPMLPVQKVASGGELSRIMLALSAVVTDPEGTGSVIFDEIDAGISGRTAQAVSEKLNTIAAETQVLCITHLPQIAAMADKHFIIEKENAGGFTVSKIRELSEEEETEELSRMLGGVAVTDAVRENAAEMRRMALKKKGEGSRKER